MLKLTTVDNAIVSGQILISPRHIVSIRAADAGNLTEVVVSTGQRYLVRESMDQIGEQTRWACPPAGNRDEHERNRHGKAKDGAEYPPITPSESSGGLMADRVDATELEVCKVTDAWVSGVGCQCPVCDHELTWDFEELEDGAVSPEHAFPVCPECDVVVDASGLTFDCSVGNES